MKKFSMNKAFFMVLFIMLSLTCTNKVHAQKVHAQNGHTKNGQVLNSGTNKSSPASNSKQDSKTGDSSEVVDNSEDGDEGSSSTEEPDDYSIKILRSEDVEKDNITTKDDYINRQFIITIPGDYVDFYNENVPEEMDDSIKSISVKLDSNGDTKIYLKTKTVRAFAVEENDEAIFVTVMAPKDMYGKIVVIDAGHGGTDPGAMGNSLVEKNLTLSILQHAKEYLDGESDIKVYYTRLTDFEKMITKGKSTDPIKTSKASLIARYTFANETQADLFISIHINAAGKTAKGTEIEYSPNNPRTNRMGISSNQLANLCLPNLLSAINSTNRNIKPRPNLAVLKYTKMPAILIESAFLTNKSDAKVLADDSKRDEIGYAIYSTILQAFEEY
ncbi:N-acetylmuramoyl-L-alanine amidase family protein [Anaeromicropila herbilytica]|uniref:MurNAc-LAA domain-containing protein n=1 Tax=Anaeromicropila herbilytica TaxID=2785025 RepID=A0A7R7ENC6_9FIRM|nr:N-acetylmuramoyl-L-alanine amidase [Anaeromicropila herbilytica]BCN31978.1 hypothetical protein bsdtb5_32730 [Anaeromicropila herbilytica]